MLTMRNPVAYSYENNTYTVDNQTFPLPGRSHYAVVDVPDATILVLSHDQFGFPRNYKNFADGTNFYFADSEDTTLVMVKTAEPLRVKITGEYRANCSYERDVTSTGAGRITVLTKTKAFVMVDSRVYVVEGQENFDSSRCDADGSAKFSVQILYPEAGEESDTRVKLTGVSHTGRNHPGKLYVDGKRQPAVQNCSV